jgi:hypothetical protein
VVVPATMAAMAAGLTGSAGVAMLKVARGGDGMQTGNERPRRIADQEPLEQGAERLTGPGPQHQLALVHARRPKVDLEAPTGAERLHFDLRMLDADQAAVDGALQAAGELPETLHGTAVRGRQRGHEFQTLEQHPRAGHRNPELGHIDEQVDQGRPPLNNAVDAVAGGSIMRPSNRLGNQAALSRRASPCQARRSRPQRNLVGSSVQATRRFVKLLHATLASHDRYSTVAAA